MNIKSFLEIEKKYNLCHMEIGGINIWEYCRFEMWNSIICAERLQLQKAHRIGSKKPIFTLIKNSVCGYMKYISSAKKNVDVCFITHERRVKENEYYDCMYTESLIEMYPNSIVFEAPYKYGHLIPTRTANMIYTDWIVIIGNVYARLQKMFNTVAYRRIYEAIKEQWEMPFGEMKKEYELQAEFDRLIKIAIEKYFLCKIQYGMYESMLKKFSPKVIVEVCHYSRQCMLVNEIAKKMNIPTIEIQHGTMHADHVAYQYMVKEEIFQLPRRIFLFSDFWKTQLHMPIDGKNLITTGFPYFEKKLEKYKNIKKTSDKKTILFISQGTIGKQLSLLAVDLSRKLDENTYRIIYKLHPGEYSDWKKVYSELVKSNIEVVDNSEKNIYEYFSVADVQIGVYSTAIYEGLGFGLQTMLYNIAHADTMSELVENEYAVFVNNADEILEELKKEKNMCVGNIFWKRNALENMNAEIKKYL